MSRAWRGNGGEPDGRRGGERRRVGGRRDHPFTPTARVAAPAFLLLGGCGGAEPTTSADDNGGLERTATLEVGQSLTLVPQWGSREVRWTVSDSNVAWVEPSRGQDCSVLSCTVPWGLSGAVSTIAPGQVTVRATTVGAVDARTATVALTVRGAPMATLRVVPESLTVRADGPSSVRTYTLRAEARDSAGRLLSRRVAWTSSDTTVVPVSWGSVTRDEPCCTQSFFARPHRVGTATITATVEGRRASAVILVQP